MSTSPASNVKQPTAKCSMQVWLKLYKTSNSIERIIRSRLRDEQASTLPRFDVMSALSQFPDGLKMSEISNLLRVSNGNITGIVERLLDEGLVSRQSVANDRRAQRILLTDEGLAVFRQQAQCHEQWISDIFEKITPQKLRALARLLDSIGDELADSEHS